MRRGLIMAVVVVAVVMSSESALGATIKVTTLADDYGTDEKTCSLREAVHAANTDVAFSSCRNGNGADRIVLRSGESYDFTRDGADDVNEVGDLDVASPITIEPNRRKRPVVNGAGLSRVFDVSESGELELSRVVVTGGFADATEGNEGGGIRNLGGLAVTGSRITLNQATGGGVANGGGISAVGFRTTIKRSQVSGNISVNVGGGINWGTGRLKISESTISGNTSDYIGGGIYLGGFSEEDRFSITASTVSGNEADDDGGGIYAGHSDPSSAKATNVTISGNYTNGSGGGIRGNVAGDFTLNAATITNNTADIDANGIGTGGAISGAAIELSNSIIAGNQNPNPGTPVLDCAGGGSENNHNLVGAGGGCSESGSNTAVANPKLKALGKYGGPTKTHALKPGSKAVGNAGSSAPRSDQRGVKRDSHPDSGAFER